MPTRKKTAPSKRSAKPQEHEQPPIRILRAGKCKSLSGKSTITYQIGFNDNKEIFFRITSNDGGGFFNGDWVAWIDIENVLLIDRDNITSLNLQQVYLRKSVNSPAFLLAALINEGLVELSEEKKRTYALKDSKAFNEAMLAAIAEKGTPTRKRKPPTVKSTK